MHKVFLIPIILFSLFSLSTGGTIDKFDESPQVHNEICDDALYIYFDTCLDKEIQDACQIYGKEYGICPELLMAIIETESRGDPNASNGDCKGLMQVSTKWHSERMQKLGIQDIYDINQNILLGTDYLYELFEKYEDVGVVLAVYHGEQNAFNGDMSSYVSGILTRSEQLERIHERMEKKLWKKNMM